MLLRKSGSGVVVDEGLPFGVPEEGVAVDSVLLMLLLLEEEDGEELGEEDGDGEEEEGDEEEEDEVVDDVKVGFDSTSERVSLSWTTSDVEEADCDMVSFEAICGSPSVIVRPETSPERVKARTSKAKADARTFKCTRYMSPQNR